MKIANLICLYILLLLNKEEILIDQHNIVLKVGLNFYVQIL